MFFRQFPGRSKNPALRFLPRLRLYAGQTKRLQRRLHVSLIFFSKSSMGAPSSVSIMVFSCHNIIGNWDLFQLASLRGGLHKIYVKWLTIHSALFKVGARCMPKDLFSTGGQSRALEKLRGSHCCFLLRTAAFIGALSVRH